MAGPETQKSPEAPKSHIDTLVRDGRAVVGSYNQEMFEQETWTEEVINRRLQELNTRIDRNESISLISLYSFNADTDRKQALQLVAQAEKEKRELTEAEKREVIAAHVRITQFEMLAKAVDAYMRVMEQYAVLKREGLVASTGDETTVFEHFARVTAAAKARIELAKMDPRRRTEADVRRLLQADNELVRLLASQDQDIPGHNPEGILPVHRLMLNMIKEDYEKYVMEHRNAARNDLSSIQRRAEAGTAAIKRAFPNRTPRDIPAEEIDKVLGTVEQGYTYDQYLRDVQILKRQADMFDKIKERGRKNIERLVNINSVMGRYQISRSQLAAIRHHFNQAYNTQAGEKPLPGESTPAAVEASRQFLESQQTNGIAVLKRYLEVVDDGVLHVGLAEQGENIFVERGRPFVARMADRFASMETCWIPDIPGTQGFLRNSAREYLMSGLYDALGWPRDAQGNPKEAKDLTDEEKKAIREKQDSCKKAIERFRETKCFEAFRESVSAAEVLLTRRDLQAERFLQEGEIDPATLPKDRVTAQNVDALITQYGGAKVYLMCFVQLQNDWGAFDAHYSRLLRDFHEVIGVHFDFSHMFNEAAKKQAVISLGMIILALVGAAIGGVVIWEGGKFIVKKTVKLTLRAARWGARSVVRTLRPGGAEVADAASALEDLKPQVSRLRDVQAEIRKLRLSGENPARLGELLQERRALQGRLMNALNQAEQAMKPAEAIKLRGDIAEALLGRELSAGERSVVQAMHEAGEADFMRVCRSLGKDPAEIARASVAEIKAMEGLNLDQKAQLLNAKNSRMIAKARVYRDAVRIDRWRVGAHATQVSELELLSRSGVTGRGGSAIAEEAGQGLRTIAREATLERAVAAEGAGATEAIARGSRFGKWVVVGGILVQVGVTALDAVDVHNAANFAVEAADSMEKDLKSFSENDKHFVCVDAGKGLYVYKKDLDGAASGDNVLFTVSLEQLRKQAAIWREASGARVALDVAGLAAGTIAIIEGAAGPVGWAIAAIEIGGRTLIEAGEFADYYKFVTTCPTWLLLKLGGTGNTVGRDERTLLDDRISDVFNDKPRALREKLVFSYFMRNLAHREPDSFRELMQSLDTPQKLDAFFENDFKKVILPFYIVQLFQSTWMANYKWSNIKELKIDTAYVNTIDPKDMERALTAAGRFCIEHLQEKQRIAWRRKLAEARAALLADASGEKPLDSRKREEFENEIIDLEQKLYRQGFHRAFGTPLRDADAALDRNNGRTRHELFSARMFRRVDEARGETWVDKKHSTYADGRFAFQDRPGIMTDWVPFNGGRGVNPREDEMISHSRRFVVDTRGIAGIPDDVNSASDFISLQGVLPQLDAVLPRLQYFPGSQFPDLSSRRIAVEQRRGELFSRRKALVDRFFALRKQMHENAEPTVQQQLAQDLYQNEVDRTDFFEDLRACEEEYRLINQEVERLTALTRDVRKNIERSLRALSYVPRDELRTLLIKERPEARWLSSAIIFTSGEIDLNDRTDREVLLRIVDTAKDFSFPRAFHVKKVREGGRTLYHVLYVDSHDIEREDPKQVNTIEQGYVVEEDGSISNGMPIRSARMEDAGDDTYGQTRFLIQTRERQDEHSRVDAMRTRVGVERNVQMALDVGRDTFIELGKDEQNVPVYGMRTRDGSLLVMRTSVNTIRYQILSPAAIRQWRNGQAKTLATLASGQWQEVNGDFIDKLKEVRGDVSRLSDAQTRTIAEALVTPNEIDHGDGSAVARLLYCFPYSSSAFGRFLPMLREMYESVGDDDTPEGYRDQVRAYMEAIGGSTATGKSPDRKAFLRVMLQSVTETNGLKKREDGEQLLTRLRTAAAEGKFGKDAVVQARKWPRDLSFWRSE